MREAQPHATGPSTAEAAVLPARADRLRLRSTAVLILLMLFLQMACASMLSPHFQPVLMGLAGIALLVVMMSRRPVPAAVAAGPLA